MKIDIFAHVMLPRYKEALYKYAHKFPTEKAIHDKRPVLTDNALRLAKLASYDDLVQVLCATTPPVEEVVGPEEAVKLARLCNDEMAELVADNPGRYVGAIANVPLNDLGAAVKEAERAIRHLGFKGIQIYTRVDGKPPSTEEMMPLYRLMADFDLPIWLHPARKLEPARLGRGKGILQPAFLHIRLALRHDGRHGEARLLGHLRKAPHHQDHHPPSGRHGALFLRPYHRPLQ